VSNDRDFLSVSGNLTENYEKAAVTQGFWLTL